MMKLPRNVLVTAPATTPVTLQQLKDNLRIATSTDDTLLNDCILDAVEWVENETQHPLITQTRRQSYDSFRDKMHIRWSPVQSVTSIAYTDTNGDSQTVSATVYRVDTDSIPARITEELNQDWPTDEADITDAVQVTYVGGYGDDPDDVPRTYRRAIIMYASWLYDPSIACGKDDMAFFDSLRCMLASEGRTLEYA